MAFPRQISNAHLDANKIPSPDAAWDSIERFALTFDGYKYWGDAEVCAEIANARRHSSLTDLRTCLFYEQRRWRHFGIAPTGDEMQYIRALVGEIRRRVQLANELLA